MPSFSSIISELPSNSPSTSSSLMSFTMAQIDISFFLDWDRKLLKSVVFPEPKNPFRMTNFIGKKSGFVDSGFAKTCNELVIGSWICIKDEPQCQCQCKPFAVYEPSVMTNMISST